MARRTESTSFTKDVQGRYTVSLNDQVVNRFHFIGNPKSPRRGLTSSTQEPRFIGLQAHTGRVLFRRIEWRAL